MERWNMPWGYVELSLILVILIGHTVADFVCQSDWMAANKSKRWDALTLHVLTYGAVLAAVVLLVNGDSPKSLWFLSANAAAHFVQDAITSRINARLWQANERHWFFVGIGADQLLHYVLLFVTAELWLS